MNEVDDSCIDVTLTDGSVDMSHAEKTSSELTAAQSHFFLNHVIENITLSKKKKTPLTWKCLTDSWVLVFCQKKKKKNSTLLLMNESDE